MLHIYTQALSSDLDSFEQIFKTDRYMNIMDSFRQYCPTTVIISAALLLLVALVFIFIHLIKPSWGAPKARTTKKNPPPKAPGALPVIGHLHKLGGGKDLLPHQVLGAMADKYGPAFTIQFGSHQTLVVSNWEMVKECFTSTNDKLFSNRPSPLVNKHVFYSEDSFGFGPYGPFWREMRKLSSLHLLSNHRLELLRHSRKSEMDVCFKELYQLCSSSTSNIYKDKQPAVLVEMKKWFEDVMFNVVARVVVGKRNLGSHEKVAGSDNEGEGNKYKKVMDEARQHMATFVVSDMIPFLWWIDYLRGIDSSMKQTAKKLDAILQTWLEEHRLHRYKQRALQLNANHEVEHMAEEEEKDFMDVMLSMAEEESIKLFDHDLDTVIKSLCLDLILGGSDTTTVTLTWTLSLLLNNRDVLRRVRDELDLHIGKERQVEESDIKNLVYLQAVFKETMRLYPAGPLNERSTMEDCNVGGYDIQADTRLLINIWKVQRDPNVWPNPSEFRPERFLSKVNSSIDVRGQDFQLIPFGSGRRTCPGVSFALQLMHLALARLIHGFELATLMDLDVDMSETPGPFNYKATALQALIIPRFHSKFYGC